MNELELLGKAIGIAVAAHKEQNDPYGAPYILHPLRVMARVQTTREKTVAILHDVVEDTDWTFEKLRQEGFPQEVISALDCLTKREKEAYEDLVGRAATNPLARRVKIADLEDNMDTRRMPEITDETKTRLEKYLKAWHSLTGR
jgi:(p)ppGpp synthase/HD superfamily hydrolase